MWQTGRTRYASAIAASEHIPRRDRGRTGHALRAQPESHPRQRGGGSRGTRYQNRAEPPEWAGPEHTVVSEDGALTTTLVGVLAERELAVTPLEATAFALGIHEDTGSLTYPTATQRDAEALAWCLRHGARQELLADRKSVV